MTGRRFVVSCLHCKRVVAIAGSVADEQSRLRAHLFVSLPGEVSNPSLEVAAALGHFRVEFAPDDEPPPNAA